MSGDPERSYSGKTEKEDVEPPQRGKMIARAKVARIAHFSWHSQSCDEIVARIND